MDGVRAIHPHGPTRDCGAPPDARTVFRLSDHQRYGTSIRSRFRFPPAGVRFGLRKVTGSVRCIKKRDTFPVLHGWGLIVETSGNRGLLGELSEGNRSKPRAETPHTTAKHGRRLVHIFCVPWLRGHPMIFNWNRHCSGGRVGRRLGWQNNGRFTNEVLIAILLLATQLLHLPNPH